MPLVHPLFLLSGVIAVVLSPVIAFFGLAIYRAAKDRPARNVDEKLLAKIQQLELEKEEMHLQFERAQVEAHQKVDRVRLLERLLIEERRNRLAESTEILALREYAVKLEQRLAKLKA